MPPLAYNPEAAFGRITPAAFAIRTALSANAAFQSLLDDPSAPDAESKAAESVQVGIVDDPWLDEDATKDDLDQLLLRAYLTSANDQALRVERGDTVAGCPSETFALHLGIRRQFRDIEMADDGGASAFLAFWDAVSALPHDLYDETRLSTNVESVDLMGMPWMPERAEAAAQGEHAMAELLITIGPPAR